MMKRTILALLLLALFFGGCGKKETEPPISDPAKPEVPSWHVPDAQLHDAVQAYRPNDAIRGLMNFGDSILIVGETSLTVLRDGVPVATATTAAGASVGQLLHDGYGCYLSDSNELQMYDRDLQPTGSYPLPEQPDGNPAIAPDGKTVYYCAGPEIKAYDLELKITRKLKFTTCSRQVLTGIWLDGTVLSCAVTYDTGEETIMYLSAQDGTLTHTDAGIAWMSTSGDAYMLQRRDGSVRQLISGSGESAPINLQLPEDAAVFPAIEVGGMTAFGEDNTLRFYNVSTGMQTAAVAVSVPVDIRYTATAGDCIWFSDGEMLYCWEPAKTPTQEETVYKTPLYTRESPDADGLAQCQTRADVIAAEHGVQILLAEAAVATPGDYVPESEYQTVDIMVMLDQLETVLQQYPAGFLKTSSKNKVQLCIVRSVSGEKAPVFYWHSATPCIVLPTGCDVADGLAMGLGYVVNSRVISASTKADKWLNLNPKNFTYGDVPEQSYLDGKDRAFVDVMSATSATEDRSRIFHQAMKPDNADTFASETMQKKLEMFCVAIRDTWGWKKSAEIYPWEQYLTNSLAYVK